MIKNRIRFHAIVLYFVLAISPFFSAGAATNPSFSTSVAHLTTQVATPRSQEEEERFRIYTAKGMQPHFADAAVSWQSVVFFFSN